MKKLGIQKLQFLTHSIKKEFNARDKLVPRAQLKNNKQALTAG